MMKTDPAQKPFERARLKFQNVQVSRYSWENVAKDFDFRQLRTANFQKSHDLMTSFDNCIESCNANQCTNKCEVIKSIILACNLLNNAAHSWLSGRFSLYFSAFTDWVNNIEIMDLGITFQRRKTKPNKKRFQK